MDATNDGINAIQSRIADLQRRFTPASAPSPAVDGTSVDTPSVDGTTTDFATLLAELQNSASAASLGLPAGMTIPAGLGMPASLDLTAAGDMRSTAARQQFATDLLKRLGLPQTKENLRAMVAWQTAEGASASFNPLATTRYAPGATDNNSVGVKNFRSYEQGLQTTIDTLRNGLYGNILAALRDGTSATRVAQAISDSPWGTGDGVSSVLASGTL